MTRHFHVSDLNGCQEEEPGSSCRREGGLTEQGELESRSIQVGVLTNPSNTRVFA